MMPDNGERSHGPEGEPDAMRQAGAGEVLFSRNGLEVVRERDTGRVYVHAADYHAGELTIDREFVDRVMPAVGVGASKQSSAHDRPGTSVPPEASGGRSRCPDILRRAFPWVLLGVVLLMVLRGRPRR